jgi:hypothetical protein
MKKKLNPSLLSKEEQRKKEKNKSLGSMPRVTVLAGCRQ